MDLGTASAVFEVLLPAARLIHGFIGGIRILLKHSLHCRQQLEQKLRMIRIVHRSSQDAQAVIVTGLNVFPSRGRLLLRITGSKGHAWDSRGSKKTG